MRRFFQNKRLPAKSFTSFESHEASMKLFSNSSFQHILHESVVAISTKVFPTKSCCEWQEYYWEYFRKRRLVLQQSFKRIFEEVFHTIARLVFQQNEKIFCERAATVWSKATKANFSFAYKFSWDFKEAICDDAPRLFSLKALLDANFPAALDFRYFEITEKRWLDMIRKFILDFFCKTHKPNLENFPQNLKWIYT